ncbi:MAG: hypothetical protein KDL10_08990, partial [Kiritimatiellae bacterium]|nr:hypothetical protein [Kiritimatiellia bacterium]
MVMGWLILSRETQPEEVTSPPILTQATNTAPAPISVPVARLDTPPEPEPKISEIEDAPAMNDLTPTPFSTSIVAQKWMEEEGYTMEELLLAQQKARESGLSEDLVNDAGVVRRHLPTHYMGPVQIDEVILPATTKAGASIPFTVRGRTPGEGFEFLRFNTTVQGSVIRINGLGFTRDPTEGVMTETTELQGEIPPLPPGEYKVFIAELGPNGTFPFTVEE